MAMSKKAASAALGKLDLTKPNRDEGGKLRLDGIEKLASQYRDTHAEIEALKQEQEERKAEIIAKAIELRLREELAGRFYKTVQSMTDDEETTLQVIWGDSYKPLDPSHEPLLRKAFGKHYDELFEPGMAAKIEATATVEQVYELLGPAKFKDLSRLVKFDPILKVRKGFMERRADLRRTFDDQTNTNIDTVVAQVQRDPSLRVNRPKG